jgi:hypothetical protein
MRVIRVEAICKDRVIGKTERELDQGLAEKATFWAADDAKGPA